MATETLLPNADGDLTEWVASAGSRYTCIDEASANGDTDYIYNAFNTSPHPGEYLCQLADPASILDGATISNVRVYCNTKALIANGQVAACIKTGGTNTVGALQANSISAYADIYQDWATKPGGGAWSYTDICSLQAGCKNASRATGQDRVTQIRVVVTYTNPTPQTYTENVSLTAVAALSSSDQASFAESLALAATVILTLLEVGPTYEEVLSLTAQVLLASEDGMLWIESLPLVATTSLSAQDTAAFVESQGLAVQAVLTVADIAAFCESLGLTVGTSLSELEELEGGPEEFIEALTLIVNAVLSSKDILVRGGGQSQVDWNMLRAGRKWTDN